jgi:3-hydroxyisobutyrate dehydrogenase-like beta-hydroxyacid dehydrogenase
MKIGFAGLGQMGRPIALNLMKSGATLSVTDRAPKSFPEFESKGVRASTEQTTIFDSDTSSSSACPTTRRSRSSSPERVAC